MTIKWTQEDIEALDDARLTALEKNASRLAAAEVLERVRQEQAFRKMPEAPRELSERVDRLLLDHEALLAARNGRKGAASKTRRAIKQKGLLAFLEGAAAKPNSLGLEPVEGAPEPEAGADCIERIIVDFADQFSPEAVEAAAGRLAAAPAG